MPDVNVDQELTDQRRQAVTCSIGTIHAWDRNVRDFTVPSERGGIHRAWRDPPSVEGSPEGAVGPEGDPDTRGGSRHARWILTCEVGL